MAMPLRSPTRVFRFGPYTVELWALRDKAPKGRVHYAFSFFDEKWGPEPVAARWDYMAPEWETYENVALGLLHFLSVQEGEEEEFFFRDYTPEQLAWRDERAAILREELRAIEEAREAGISGGRKRKGRRMSGVFDVFMPKEEEEKEREEKETRSLMERFLTPFAPALPPPEALPGLPGPAPKKGLIRAALEPFEVLAPAPKAVPPITPLPTTPPEAVPELWEAFVPADVREAIEREEELEPGELFAPAFEASPHGDPEPTRPMRPEQWTFIAPRGAEVDWVPLSPREVLMRLRKMMDLDDLFERVQGIRETPEFQADVASEAVYGRPGIIWLEPVTEVETFRDLSQFLGIPWEVIEGYLTRGTEEEERLWEERLWVEVLDPMAVSLTRAFEMTKPAELPGWFGIESDPNTERHWLTYAEAELPLLAEPSSS